MNKRLKRVDTQAFLNDLSKGKLSKEYDKGFWFVGAHETGRHHSAGAGGTARPDRTIGA